MTQSFDTPEFLNYLQKRLNFEPFVLRDLVKDHSIFETAEILVKNYNVDKDKLGQIFAGYLGFAYVDINNVIFDPQFMKSIPKDYLKMQVVLPLYKFGPAITVATARPNNPFLQNNIEKQLHSVISLVFSFPQDIINYIEENYDVEEKVSTT